MSVLAFAESTALLDDKNQPELLEAVIVVSTCKRSIFCASLTTLGMVRRIMHIYMCNTKLL